MMRKPWPQDLSFPPPESVADGESDALTVLGAIVVLAIGLSAYLWVH